MFNSHRQEGIIALVPWQYLKIASFSESIKTLNCKWKLFTTFPRMLKLSRWLLCWCWWQCFRTDVGSFSLYFSVLLVKIEVPKCSYQRTKRGLVLQCRHYCKCRTYSYKVLLSYCSLKRKALCILYDDLNTTLNFAFLWHDGNMSVNFFFIL